LFSAVRIAFLTETCMMQVNPVFTEWDGAELVL